jgi:hypothetical protein
MSGPHLSDAARPDTPPRLARAATIPTAPSRRSPDRLAHRASVPTEPPPRQRAARPPRSEAASPGLPRRSPVAVVPRRRPRTGEPLVPRPRPHCAYGPSVISAQRHSNCFFYFLIYSIHCKFKNLCRIHLNSENHETNFFGKF